MKNKFMEQRLQEIAYQLYAKVFVDLTNDEKYRCIDEYNQMKNRRLKWNKIFY